MSILKRLSMTAGVAVLLTIMSCLAILVLPSCADDDPATLIAQQGRARNAASGGENTSTDSPQPGGLPADMMAGGGEQAVVEEVDAGPHVLVELIECVGMHPEYEDDGLYDIKIIFIADLPGNELVIPEEYLEQNTAGTNEAGTTQAMEDLIEGEAGTAEQPVEEPEAEQEPFNYSEHAEQLEAFIGHNVWQFTMYDKDGNEVATDLREASIPTRVQSSMVWQNFYCRAKPVRVEINLTDVETTSGEDTGGADGGEGKESRGGGGGRGSDSSDGASFTS